MFQFHIYAFSRYGLVFLQPVPDVGYHYVRAVHNGIGGLRLGSLTADGPVILVHQADGMEDHRLDVLVRKRITGDDSSERVAIRLLEDVPPEGIRDMAERIADGYRPEREALVGRQLRKAIHDGEPDNRQVVSHRPLEVVHYVAHFVILIHGEDSVEALIEGLVGCHPFLVVILVLPDERLRRFSQPLVMDLIHEIQHEHRHHRLQGFA